MNELFPWEMPTYYKPSFRDQQIDAMSSHTTKHSPTAKNTSFFDPCVYDEQDIVIDFITDKPVWENKTLSFEYQKNKDVQFWSIYIGVKDNTLSTSHVFSWPVWQIASPHTTHGWIDEVSTILNRCKTIWIFDASLFYGIMRFYQPQEQLMMRWRLKTRGLADTLKKKYRCWKQLPGILSLNRILCSNRYRVADLIRTGEYEAAVRQMKIRTSCLTILFRKALSTEGITIPVATTKRKRNDDNTQPINRPQTQTIHISYTFN